MNKKSLILSLVLLVVFSLFAFFVSADIHTLTESLDDKNDGFWDYEFSNTSFLNYSYPGVSS